VPGGTLDTVGTFQITVTPAIASAVPEPGSLGLGAAGILAAALLRRRRR